MKKFFVELAVGAVKGILLGIVLLPCYLLIFNNGVNMGFRLAETNCNRMLVEAVSKNTGNVSSEEVATNMCDYLIPEELGFFQTMSGFYNYFTK